MRAGFTPFFISPKNSPIAIAHLLKVTHCSVVYVSKDEATQTFWHDTVAKYSSTEGAVPLHEFPLCDYEDLWVGKPDEKFEMKPFPVEWIDRFALICHSSGMFSHVPRLISGISVLIMNNFDHSRLYFIPEAARFNS